MPIQKKSAFDHSVGVSVIRARSQLIFASQSSKYDILLFTITSFPLNIANNALATAVHAFCDSHAQGC